MTKETYNTTERAHTRRPAQMPVQLPVRQYVRKPVRQPVQLPVQPPARQAVRQPVQLPVQPPVRQAVRQPVQLPVQPPVRQAVRQPVGQHVRQPERNLPALVPGAAPGAHAVPPASAAPPDDAAPASTARRRAGRIILTLILLLTTAMLIGLTPIFSITEINVSGNHYYSAGQIAAKSGLKLSQNGFSALLGKNVLKLFSMRCDGAEQAIKAACPYVKSVAVRYAPPRTIGIEVEERLKSFVVPYFGSGLLIDGEGVVVDIIKDYRQSDMPVALGLDIKRYEIGEALDPGGGGLEAAISVVNALRQADRDGGGALAWEIETIDVGDPYNLSLSTGRGITVNLGDGTDLYYRVSAAKEILANGIKDGESGVVVFSNGARPVFIPGGSSGFARE